MEILGRLVLTVLALSVLAVVAAVLYADCEAKAQEGPDGAPAK